LAIQEGRIDLIPETVMNVVVFMPIGVVLSCLSPRIKWWMVLLIGIGFSVLIEALQFFLKRGFAEFDDVFHNMLGCLLGIMIVAIIKGFWQFCSYLFVPQMGEVFERTQRNLKQSE
jgi:glycopeptide antibiotics resistance protein